MNDEQIADEFKLRGYTVKIIQDQDASNPRDDDNVGTMVCFHKRYCLGDCDQRGHNNLGIDSDNYNGWEAMKQALIDEHDAWVVLPLYLYDHSGITMRTSDFGDHWDSGCVGFIFVTKKKAHDELCGPEDTLEERAKKCLQSEVETYDQYLTGDVYGYTIEDADGKEIEACWGFFGLDYCKEEATSCVPDDPSCPTEDAAEETLA